MNFFILCTLFFSFSMFTIGLLIYLKRRDEIGKTWFGFSILCFFWAAGYAYQLNNDIDYGTALRISRISDAFAVFIPIAWLNFTYVFLEMRRDRKVMGVLLAVSLFILLLSPTRFFIRGLQDKSSLGIAHFVDGGWAFHVFGVLFITVVSYAVYLIIKELCRKGMPRVRRRQLILLFLAALFGFGGGSTAFLPVYGIDIPVQWGAAAMIFFPILIALAMSRYQMLDIEQIIQAAHRDKLAAIGTLSVAINHEIKNPISVIKGTAQSHLDSLSRGIYSSKDDEMTKTMDVLNKTIRQSERAVQIIERLARFAKKDSNHLPQPETVNLKDLIQNILPLIQHEMDLEKIRFQTEISVGAECVCADAQHLEEIIFNLFVNACQAMKDGGNLILKSVKTQNGIEIVIEDSGPGMSEDKIKRIFEPFYTTKEQGTGLGLYITRQLVERNNGTISVDSRLGQGTRFVLGFSSEDLNQ